MDKYGRALGILYDNEGFNINNYLKTFPYCYPYIYKEKNNK